MNTNVRNHVEFWRKRVLEIAHLKPGEGCGRGTLCCFSGKWAETDRCE